MCLQLAYNNNCSTWSHLHIGFSNGWLSPKLKSYHQLVIFISCCSKPIWLSFFLCERYFGKCLIFYILYTMKSKNRGIHTGLKLTWNLISEWSIPLLLVVHQTSCLRKLNMRLCFYFKVVSDQHKVLVSRHVAVLSKNSGHRRHHSHHAS